MKCDRRSEASLILLLGALSLGVVGKAGPLRAPAWSLSRCVSEGAAGFRTAQCLRSCRGTLRLALQPAASDQ